MEPDTIIQLNSEPSVALNSAEPESSIRPETVRATTRFTSFGIASLLYALAFGLCLHKNSSGITVPLYAVLTVIYVSFCTIKLQKIPSVKEFLHGYIYSGKTAPYLACVILLGISSCLTDDSFIIFCNHCGIFILVLISVTKCFYNDTKWLPGNYFKHLTGMTFSPLGYISAPFEDFKSYKKNSDKNLYAKIRPVISGILLAVPVLFIILQLLTSADIVFAEAVYNLLDKVTLPSNTISLSAKILITFIYTYGIFTNLSLDTTDNKIKAVKKHETVTGITFTGLITLVYLMFCMIQISYFIGNVALPDDYTYSEYAREGFFQLLMVAFLNLVIVMSCHNRFGKSRILDVILTIMCGCTYIMLASAALRITIYIKAYDLTYLRLLVIFALIVIGFIMAGVIIHIYNDKFPFTNYCILVTAALYIILSFAKPSYIITKYNLDSMLKNADNEEIFISERDMRELFALGTDAAPAIYEFATGLSDEVLHAKKTNLYNEIYDYFSDTEKYVSSKDAINEFNFSRYKALKYAEIFCAD